MVTVYKIIKNTILNINYYIILLIYISNINSIKFIN